jgi:hypothetical protein
MVSLTAVTRTWRKKARWENCFGFDSVTGLGEIRSMGDCLLVVVFLNITEVAHIFLQLRLSINFDQNVLGYVLGDIFHKLIWSPWLCITLPLATTAIK